MSIGAIQDGAQFGALTPRAQASSVQPRASVLPAQSGTVADIGSQSDTNNRQTATPSLEQAVDRLKQFVSTSKAEINFAIDGSSGVQVVKIVDRNTKDVIRQIPSEEAISLAMALDKLQGLFVRDKA